MVATVALRKMRPRFGRFYFRAGHTRGDRLADSPALFPGVIFFPEPEYCGRHTRVWQIKTSHLEWFVMDSRSLECLEGESQPPEYEDDGFVRHVDGDDTEPPEWSMNMDYQQLRRNRKRGKAKPADTAA
jgi:hypothetical protein